jgi:hypothetical protein
LSDHHKPGSCVAIVDGSTGGTASARSFREKKKPRASKRRAREQMKSAKGRRVRVEAKAENGHSGLGRLAILLKEVLKQIPSEDAERLFEACRNNKSFILHIQENSRGSGYVCAVRYGIVERFPTEVMPEIDYLDPDTDPTN